MRGIRKEIAKRLMLLYLQRKKEFPHKQVEKRLQDKLLKEIQIHNLKIGDFNMGEDVKTISKGSRQKRDAESISVRSNIVRSAKAEKERQRIKAEIENAKPVFGTQGMTKNGWGDIKKKDGFVKVPGGRTIVIHHFLKRSYSVFYITKGGNTGGDEHYSSEKKAIAAQKRMYEEELAKVKKRYNL